MSYRVKIHNSGHEFDVRSGESVLDAALRNGITLPYGCRDGACGSCAGTIVAGEVEYLDGPPPVLDSLDTSEGNALFCQAHPRSDLLVRVREIDAADNLPVRKLPCRVAKLEQLTHDVMRVLLKLPPVERIQFYAGQYIDILTKDGQRRAFSIANAPHDDEFVELHIRKIPGGKFTDQVFHELQPKAILRIEGPLGSFYLREDSDRPVILMGGGTGYAPLKGILEHAFRIGFTHPIHLFWGVRQTRDLYHQDRIRNWEKQFPHFTYTPVLSEPDAAEGWTGETGMVGDVVIRHHTNLSRHDVYMSGPPAMIESARLSFLAHGMSDERAFSDAFEFSTDSQAKTEESD